MWRKINSYMFGLLKNFVGPAIKYLGPAVAGWGLNKFFNSNMFNSIVPKPL